MDQSQAPVLDAIAEFRRRGDVVYGPPAHKQGRGVDPRVLDVLGERAFASDGLMLNGLDDRMLSGGILEQAEALLAEAVHADKALFSTCGSSLSVKASMLATAGPGEKLLLVRNSHKSVVSGLLLSAIEPVWVQPRWDPQLEVAHPPTAADVAAALDAHPDAKGVLLVSPTDYGTCAELAAAWFVEEAQHLPGIDLDLDAWRRADGVADLDPLKVCFDVWRLGISGYDAASWLREHHRVNLGVADHRRMMAMFSHGDDDTTLAKLLDALRDLVTAHPVRDEPLRTVEIPAPGELETRTVMLPGDAFYAPVEQVKLDDAGGRICAELVTPYPPGVQALAPGELVTDAHIAYLRSGVVA